MRAPAWAGAALALLGAGCVDGDYNRRRIYQEPLPEAVDALAVGTSDVGAVVDSLGAPLFVIEVGLGLALAWGWEDVTNWNVEVSGPIGDAQGTVRYTSETSTIRGLVLFFDEAWRLTSVRRGFLGDLLPRRRPPRDVDLDISARSRDD